MPPPPGGNGLQSWQVREWFEDPGKPTPILGVNFEYSLTRLREALRPIIFDSSGNIIKPGDGGDGRPVRNWHGYANILTGIKLGIIIITSNPEWDILVKYAADNGEDIDEICDLAESKGNYIAPGCPRAPVPIVVHFLLFCSFFILFLNRLNLIKIKAISLYKD